MFLKLLNQEQREALFVLAQQMIVADGIVAEQEMNYLDRLFWESSGYGQAPTSDLDREVDLSVFADTNAKLIVGAELLIIAVVDGEYHPAEAAFANKVIEQFNLTRKQHEELCRVAEQAAAALGGMQGLLD